MNRPSITPFNHTKRTTSHTSATTITNIILDDDGPILRPVQRTGRAYIQTPGIGTVFTHIGTHEPTELRGIRIRWVVDPLFDSFPGRPKCWHTQILGGAACTGFGCPKARHPKSNKTSTRFAGLFDLFLALFNKRHMPP